MMVTKKPMLANLNDKYFYQLIDNAKDGNEQCFNKILESFKPLINSLASKFSINPSYKDDLVQEGIIGLYFAITKFDINKSDNFKMYAYFWIKQAISRMADKSSSLIRIPIRKHQKLRKIRKERFFENKKLNTLIDFEFNFISIDDSSVSGEDHYLSEKIPSEDNPFKYIESKENEEDFKFLLSMLSKRERDIIEKRYGLVNSVPLTLREIAHQYKLTSESIRKIEMQALKKMQKAYQACEDI